MTSPHDADVAASHLAQHLDWMRRCGRAARTVHCRRSVVEQVARTLGHDPATATLDELEAWQRGLPTMDNVRWSTSILRPYFRYLRDRGVRPDDPAALLPMPVQRRRLPRPIGEDDLARAIGAAPPRLRPWLLLAGWSGLRAAEIAAATREAFTLDPTGQPWLRVQGKGDRERQVPVPPWVWAIIEPDLPASGPCWWMLYKQRPVTPRHVSTYCSRYLHAQGIATGLHSLRHRVATEVLSGGGNLRLVQDLLGHAKLDQLAVYTRINPAEMGAAVNALLRPAPRTPAPRSPLPVASAGPASPGSSAGARATGTAPEPQVPSQRHHGPLRRSGFSATPEASS